MPDQENRTYAYTKLTRQFDVILDTAKLRVAADGSDRTLYSLRHTSLMHHLQQGGDVNPLIFAKNARTSVEMLERFICLKLRTRNIVRNYMPKSPANGRKPKASCL
jgi:hypothetical protein